MVFLGLVAMSDPPRQGVREAIEKCHRASIRIIMVTGDYGLTALSIAKKIGIVQGDDARVVSGIELADIASECRSLRDGMDLDPQLIWMIISSRKLLKAKSFLLV